MKYSCKKTLLDTWQKKEKGVKQRKTERGKLLIQTFTEAPTEVSGEKLLTK